MKVKTFVGINDIIVHIFCIMHKFITNIKYNKKKNIYTETGFFHIFLDCTQFLYKQIQLKL